MQVDWQRIILNLKAAGMSYAEISRRVGIDAQSVGHIVRDEVYEPKFSKGLALLNLHYDVCAKKHKLGELKL